MSANQYSRRMPDQPPVTLGFTFRPRGAKDEHSAVFSTFLPAISKRALDKMAR
jgi:RNA-directed DNA polymerase